MLVRDAVEAHMFGRMDERLDVVELLIQYLEDPRPRKEVLEEIIERISAKGTWIGDFFRLGRRKVLRSAYYVRCAARPPRSAIAFHWFKTCEISSRTIR